MERGEEGVVAIVAAVFFWCWSIAGFSKIASHRILMLHVHDAVGADLVSHVLELR
jgi:hypothetical protein